MENDDISKLQISESQRRRFEYLKKRRKVRYIRVFFSRIRMLLRLCAVYLLVIGLWKFMHLSQWYFPQNVFKTYNSDRIEFEGNRIATNKHIFDAVKRVKIPDKAIYLIDIEPFNREILSLAPIKRVYVKRFGFPARLKIIVEEHEPAFSVAPKPDVPPLAIFTTEGTVIGAKYLPFEGMDNTFRVLTYDDYLKWPKKNAKYLVYLAKMAEAYSSEKVKYIDMKNPDDVYIQLNTVSIRLGALDKTVFDRLAKIEAVLPQMKNLKDKVKYVDLRWEDSTYIKLKE